MELWLTDTHSPNWGITIKIKETLFSGKSPYQRIDVLDTYEFGRMLVLDGIVQVTERDEFIYHEMLVHVPFFFHPHPKKVLVIGGGDGGAIREAVKHPCLEEVTLVEIDEMVVKKSQEFFPSISCGLDHPKARICFEDGIEFIKKNEDAFDIILIDSTDPVGPAVGLFAEEFYGNCFRALKADGIISAQSDSPQFNPGVLREGFKRLKKHFPLVKAYCTSVPTYISGIWSFLLASKKYDPVYHFQKERFFTEKIETRCYNEEMHGSSFSLPNFAKELLS